MRLIGATVAGALILMVWSMIFWMALPFHHDYVLSTDAATEANLVEATKDIKEPGHYWVPGGRFVEGASAEEAKKAREAHVEAMKKGPRMMVVYHPEGANPMSGAIFGGGLGFFLVSCLLAAVMLKMAKINCVWGRITFVALLGVFGSVSTVLTDAHWMMVPKGFPVMTAISNVVGWILAGIAVGAIMRPKTD